MRGGRKGVFAAARASLEQVAIRSSPRSCRSRRSGSRNRSRDRSCIRREPGESDWTGAWSLLGAEDRHGMRVLRCTAWGSTVVVLRREGFPVPKIGNPPGRYRKKARGAGFG
ncbi:hypothetical protein GCM10022205_60830 [Spinactinospora alkalitolerans]